MLNLYLLRRETLWLCHKDNVAVRTETLSLSHKSIVCMPQGHCV